MKHKSLFVIACISSSFCFGEPVKAYWTTTLGNNARTGYVNVTVDPNKLKLAWKKQFGEPVGGRYAPVITSPVLTDKAIYLFETTTDHTVPGKLDALNPATGEFLWRQDIKSTQFETARLFDLTFYQNKLYAIEDEHNDDPKLTRDVRINAYLADNGAQIFSVLTNYGAGAWYNTPTVVDDVVYAGSLQRELALNANDGTQKWSIETLKDSDVSTTAVAGNYLLRNKTDGLYIVNRTTGEIESAIVATTDPTMDYEINLPAWDEATHTAFSTLTFDPKNTCNGCWVTTQLSAYDIEQKTVKWKKILPAVSQPVFADKEIYYTSDKTLFAANIINGNVNWSLNTTEHLDQLLLTANLIFASSSAGHKTYAISRTSHAIVWQTDEAGRLTIDNKRLYIENSYLFFPHLAVYSFQG